MRDAARALELAHEVGFDLAGVAPLRPPAAAERFRRWLADGYHADMGWLARNAERIADPRRVLPEGRSLLVVGLGHARPAVELADGARVARYATGRDYHNVIGRLLRKLARALEREGLVRSWRAVVDAGPLLERSHAAEAGLGFESKAANLLERRFGPWFFLAELLLDAELEPTPGPAPGSCGTCTACLDACPTAAIVAPGRVDSNRCISYHTIENRGAVPAELHADHDAWVFGCDVCSEVCPWGRSAPAADGPDAGSGRFGTHPAVAGGRLVDWLGERDDARFRARHEGSPLRRARREGLARNAAIALGARPSEAGGTALRDALERDPAAQVREAAGWSLARAHARDAGVRDALERALGRETDPAARAGLRAALDASI